jgi:hypothetical protein
MTDMTDSLLFRPYRYHVFKIKAPIGMKITVQIEEGNPDPNALKCMLPQYEDMTESEREAIMKSKSSKKEYRVGDKAGEQIGRVQYFLNTVFKELLQDGSAEDVYGYVKYHKLSVVILCCIFDFCNITLHVGSSCMSMFTLATLYALGSFCFRHDGEKKLARLHIINLMALSMMNKTE